MEDVKLMNARIENLKAEHEEFKERLDKVKVQLDVLMRQLEFNQDANRWHHYACHALTTKGRSVEMAAEVADDMLLEFNERWGEKVDVEVEIKG